MLISREELQTEEDVRVFFQEQTEIIFLLKIIRELSLKEACLCAGTLRNTVWNFLAGKPNQLSKDVDVIFFDKELPYEENAVIQTNLQGQYPNYDWEVKNQAYMHHHNGCKEAYTSAADGIAHFPECCTAIGAWLTETDNVALICPYGVGDLVHFVVSPTPLYQMEGDYFDIYAKRIAQKNWQAEWPQLEIRKEGDKKSQQA